VIFKNRGLSAAAAAQMASDAGGEITHFFSKYISAFVIRVPNEAALDGIRRNPNVQLVEEHATVSILTSNDRKADGMLTPTVQDPAGWQLDRIDQASGTDGDYHWSEPEATGRNIYIVDTGIRRTHDEFTGRVATGYYVSGSSSTDDCHGHGTKVASMAAGTTYGTAKGATIVPVKVDDGDCDRNFSTGDVIDGLEWVLDQEDPYAIVNTSWSANGGSWSIDLWINALLDDKYVVVAGAGNDDDDACEDSPGRVSGVITVGASTSSDARRFDSNYGTCLDLFAPGNDIRTADKDSDSDFSDGEDGTSLSSGLVSGIAYAITTEGDSLAPSSMAEIFVGYPLAGAAPSAISGALSGIGSGSPNLLLYAPRSYAQIIGLRVVTTPGSKTWISRAYGGDKDEYAYLWETSTNGTNWTTVGTGDEYSRSFNWNDEFTLYMRLTVTNEFGDDTEHEIEIDVDVPCGQPPCPT